MTRPSCPSARPITTRYLEDAVQRKPYSITPGPSRVAFKLIFLYTSGYSLFTSDFGGQTPCYSPLNHVAAVPTLTAGLAGEPTDTSKPTSAVINIVWAVYYQVQTPSHGLSTGAMAGIGVGAALGGLALIGTLIFVLWRAKRSRHRQAQAYQNPNAAVAAPGGVVQPQDTAQSSCYEPTQY